MTVSSTRHGLLNHQPINVIGSHFFVFFSFFIMRPSLIVSFCSEKFLLWGTRTSNRQASVCSESYWVQTSAPLAHLHPACTLAIFLWIIALLVLKRVSVASVTVMSIAGAKFPHLYRSINTLIHDPYVQVN